jgi:hypothetical protein
MLKAFCFILCHYDLKQVLSGSWKGGGYNERV